MRKRTISFWFDKIFWYLLYFLPVIAYLIYLATCSGFADSTLASSSFSVFLSNTGLANLITDNVVFTSLLDIFATGGILGFVEASSPIFVILTWFINVMIMHLFVDFLLFIPRLCHKWLGKLTQGE